MATTETKKISLTAREERRKKWWGEKQKGEQNTEGNTGTKSKTSKTAETGTSKEKTDKKMPHETTIKNTKRIGQDKTSVRKGKKKKTDQYYIIFVGNLNYSTTELDIANHFISAGCVKDVRLLTDKTTKRSRGCAYVEFTSVGAHKDALQFHQTMLDGRRINVEFTSAGRKTDKRMEKLKIKNEKAGRFKMVGRVFNDEAHSRHARDVPQFKDISQDNTKKEPKIFGIFHDSETPAAPLDPLWKSRSKETTVDHSAPGTSTSRSHSGRGRNARGAHRTPQSRRGGR